MPMPNENNPAEITYTTVLVNGIPTKIADTQRVVKNLMTGKDIIIDKDTPLCCDPSSETYWSM